MRIVRGNAKDLVLPPSGSDEFVFLARRVGYAAVHWQQGATQLEADLGRHMQLTREFFAGRFRAV
jgi:glutamate-ammonia-ligase adenylyltransferase